MFSQKRACYVLGCGEQSTAPVHEPQTPHRYHTLQCGEVQCCKVASTHITEWLPLFATMKAPSTCSSTSHGLLTPSAACPRWPTKDPSAT
jgi:hypothetical protein